MKKLFITTAIDYVNGSPHLGHALEKIQADAIARYHRLLGEDVLFLTGTDENSLKNVRAALEENMPVKEFVDRNAEEFKSLGKAFNLSLDDFIRTTEPRHIKGAQKLWQSCQKDIYKKKYKGLYCVGCEEFYKESELKNGLCPEHGKEPELVEEENWFFALSKYEKEIKRIIEKDKMEIIPSRRKNELLSFIEQGLQDICISRSNERAKNWGVDVPGDSSQKMWCWFDALSNYLTALGYGGNEEKFKKYWQKNENILHVIGKGISRFHAIYWTGILLSAGLNLPSRIFIHGYITVNGQKMSKSIGDVINPFDLVKKYNKDSVRYFLLREISPTKDGDFTYERFEQRYNADLASGLGNLLSRVLTLAENKGKELSPEVKKEIERTKKNFKSSMQELKLNEALNNVWGLISFCDKYIDREKPWETKKPKVISSLLIVLSEIAEMLKPFLPETSEKMIKQLKAVKKGEPLFPRL